MVATASRSYGSEYLKAVTYFGDAWPVNYWNSNTDRAGRDFAGLKREGFNAVILVVPWGEFQPGVNPVRYNDGAYAALTKVCQAARAHDLKVFMRVSYLWDMYPGVEMADTERANSLISNDDLMPAWSQYLGRINSATQGCAVGSFISWEDFWHVISLVSNPRREADNAALSRRIGFDSWARKYAGREFLDRYAAVASRLGAYPIPPRDSPDFREVFAWFDDQVMKRLMPALARELPGASVEARVDDDALLDGKKVVGWYDHKQTYEVSSSPFVMTYWAPAMGANNRGEVEPAEKVMKRFLYIQDKVARNTKNKIFIEQFLFKDNTPAMALNAAIVPGEVSGFIRSAAGPLARQTSGYALWGAQDYDAGMLYNGFFSQGEQGWEFSGGASVAKAGDDFVARLPDGGAITQSVPAGRDHFRAFAKQVHLRLRAQGSGVIAATYGGVTRTANVGGQSALVQLAFPPAAGDSKLSIAGKSGPVSLTDVYLFSFTQISGVRDALGAPGPHLADVVALNTAIDLGEGLPSRLSASDHTLSGATGVYYPEQAASGWYAWTGPEVQVRIFAKANSIRVRGYLKPSMFKAGSGCTLNSFVDGARVSSTVFKQDAPIELALPISTSSVGKAVDFRLSSSCALNPRKAGLGADDRTLSFILNEISAQ
jgi:hypothetical protein